MKQPGKRLISLILSVLLSVLSPLTAMAGEISEKGLTGSAYQEQYVEGLMERYEEYIASDSYLELINGEFAHTRYMEELMDKLSTVAYSGYVEEGDSWLEKEWKRAKALNHNMNAVTFNGVIWSARFLTDKNLNQEAYETYLMNLLAMQEKGYSSTVIQQAEYDTAVDAGQTVFDLGWLTLKTAVDLKFIPLDKVLDGDLWRALKRYEQYTNGIKFSSKLEMDGLDALSVISYLNIDTRRKTFLEELSGYANKNDHKKLSQAAKTMVDMSNLRLAGMVSEFGNGYAAADFVNGASEMMTNDGFLEVISGIASKALKDKALDSKALGKRAVKCGLKFASVLGPISVGLQLGGLVGSLWYGEEYEWTGEVTVMYEIGEALKSAHQSAVVQVASALNDSERYEAACKLVSSGEALCLALCRGEYAAFQYMTVLRRDAEKNLKKLNEMKELSAFTSPGTLVRIRLAENQLEKYLTAGEYEAEYNRQAARIDKLYQSVNAIIPVRETVKNNGHTVVGYRGDIYYIRYHEGSFEPTGLFCQYMNEADAVNQLVCRQEDGSESTIYSGPISGNIYLWKDWIAVETNDGDIAIIELDSSGRAGKNSAVIKDGRIEGIDEAFGRLICSDGEGLFSVDMSNTALHRIRNRTNDTGISFIGIRVNTVYMAEQSGDGEITLLSADSDGGNVCSLGKVAVSSEIGFMGRIYGAQVTDEYLYALYACVAGTGFFLQEAAIVRADLKNPGKVETLLDVGEVSAVEFFVESDDNGQDVLYYVNEPDMIYTLLHLEEAVVHETGIQKMLTDGSMIAAEIPVSCLGDTVYLDGAMKRRMDGELEYTTLIPASVIDGLAECELGQKVDGKSDAAIIHDVELIDGTVYFSLTYNQRESINDFGWRPSYRHRYTRFYQMEAGSSEVRQIYQY
ncbi:MAG: hypothetical protein ACI39W_04345 [Brotaphodocola sp.]